MDLKLESDFIYQFREHCFINQSLEPWNCCYVLGLNKEKIPRAWLKPVTSGLTLDVLSTELNNFCNKQVLWLTGFMKLGLMGSLRILER